MCGDAGKCHLSAKTLKGARAVKIECDKLVDKLDAGSSEVDKLLKANDKMLQKKYRKLSKKCSYTIASMDSSSGGGSAVEGDDDE